MRRYGTILSLQDEEDRDHSFFAVVLTQFGTFVEFRLPFCGDGESPKIGMHRCMCEHESSNSMTFYAAAPLSRVPRTLSSCNISLAGINRSLTVAQKRLLSQLSSSSSSRSAPPPAAHAYNVQHAAKHTESAHREHPEYRVSISRGAPTRNRQPSTSPRPSLLHRPRTARPSTSRRRFEQREREHARLIVHAHAHAAARGAATGLLRQRYLGRRA